MNGALTAQGGEPGEGGLGLVRSVLDRLSTMPIGHRGDMHAAVGSVKPAWGKPPQWASHTPQDKGLSLQLAYGSPAATPRLWGQLWVGRDQRRAAGFRGADATASLDGSWPAMPHFMVTKGTEQWLIKFTRHFWLAVTCEERQVTVGEFWL